MEVRSNITILEPTLVHVPSSVKESRNSNCQVSAHLVTSKSFLREAAYVFPNQDLTDLVVISTMQKARVELVRIGDEVEEEKDRLILSVRAVMAKTPASLSFLLKYCSVTVLRLSKAHQR